MDPRSNLPYVIALNCLEQCEQEAAAMSDICVLEHVGLVEGMLEKVAAASIVILPSIQYLPRAAQRKLSPNQLLLCLGAGPDMRALESSVAEELGLRLVHLDVPRADEIADTVMALMLGLVRNSHTLAAQGCTSASWHGGFRDAWAGMRRLRGLTLGLVGVNAAGRAVARRALAFGMKIVYCDLEAELLGQDVAEAKRKGKVRKALQAAGKGMMTLRQTLEQADIVSLHCSLKDDTLHLINDKTISYFKKGSVLVNVSSCHLVSDSALKRALQSGLLSCCALDGVEGPQWMEAWVREFPNVLILPRSADHSAEAWGELGQKAARAIRTFLTEGRVVPDAVVVEDLEAEEAAWATLGQAAAVVTAALPAPTTPGSRSGQAASNISAAARSMLPGLVPGLVSHSAPLAVPVTLMQPSWRSGGKSAASSSATSSGPSSRDGAAAVFAAASERSSGSAGLDAKAVAVEGAGGESSGPTGGAPKAHRKYSRERVSFGEVEVIQARSGDAVDSASPQSGTQYDKQGSSSSLQECPEAGTRALTDGQLIALRVLTKSGATGNYFAARKSAEGAAVPFSLCVSDSSQPPPEQASQFVVVCDNDLMGCRSVYANGRFLQATSSGELLFVNEDLDLAESWYFDLSSDTPARLRLTNALHEKVVLEAVVETFC